MGKKLKMAVFSTGMLAAASVVKAASEFIKYKKLKNKDIYINTELKDIQDLRPVIRKSICTGEMEAGFKDKAGNFTSYMLISSDQDLESFKAKYDISGSIPVEY